MSNLSEIIDCIRNEVEMCDHLQGFEITNSINGGTGSGLGSRLWTEINSEYKNKPTKMFSVIPSPKFNDNILEFYNAGLSLSQMIYLPDNVLCYKNQALNDICCKTFKTHTNDDLNKLIATTMSFLTPSYRFPGDEITNLRKQSVFMSPFTVKLVYSKFWGTLSLTLL
jgi:tubulin beta